MFTTESWHFIIHIFLQQTDIESLWRRSPLSGHLSRNFSRPQPHIVNKWHSGRESIKKTDEMTAITVNSSHSRMGQGKGFPSVRRNTSSISASRIHSPCPVRESWACHPLPRKAILSCSPNPETNLGSSSTSEEGKKDRVGPRETPRERKKRNERFWNVHRMENKHKISQQYHLGRVEEEKILKAFTHSNKDSILNSSPSSQHCQGVWRRILGLPPSRNPKSRIPKATEDSTT